MASLMTSSNAHSLITPVASSLRIRPNLKTSTGTALMVVRKHRFREVKVLKKIRIRSEISCKWSLESDNELDLVGEILDFMKISRNQNDFPTKEELLDAGRIDLIGAIIKKCGWLPLGWDDFDDENGCDSKECDDIRDLNTRFDHSLSSLTSYSSSHQCASSSGRSVETVNQEDAWLEGILYRLEKHKSLSSGTSMQEDGHCIYDSCKVNSGQTVYGSVDVDLTASKLYSLEKPNRHVEIDSSDIKSRLQQMQLELSSPLRLLRSIKDEEKYNLSNGHKTSSSELQLLYDTGEFHENENFNGKDRLKSVRAELAVLERKLASSIIDAQKLVTKKQRRIDGGCRRLQLHNVCIFWHDSASEVLLAGSFDGWTAQREMKKSEAGVFYLSFKLYPGRYEFKFIVDGVWRVDLLRPIVNNNGYENNVLIVPE